MPSYSFLSCRLPPIRSRDCGAVHEFLKTDDPSVLDRKNMGKVAGKLQARFLHPEGIGSHGHNLIVLGNELARLKADQVLLLRQPVEEIGYTAFSSALPGKR